MKIITLLLAALIGMAGMNQLERPPKPPPGGLVEAGPLRISPEARKLIVDFETGGKGYYDRCLSRPTWPQGQSGVTVGVGYDLGYNTRGQILSDWESMPESSRNALAGCAGVKGVAAKQRAAAIRFIVVPWVSAEKVFVAKTMPRFGSMADKAFPGIRKTHAHVQGSVLSIVFNRGASMTGASRLEMREMRDQISADRVKEVPNTIRRMKRLWIGTAVGKGLCRRRDAEAALIEASF